MRVTTTPSRSTVACPQTDVLVGPRAAPCCRRATPRGARRVWTFRLRSARRARRCGSTRRRRDRDSRVVTVVMTDTLLPYRRLHNRLRAARHVPCATVVGAVADTLGAPCSTDTRAPSSPGLHSSPDSSSDSGAQPRCRDSRGHLGVCFGALWFYPRPVARRHLWSSPRSSSPTRWMRCHGAPVGAEQHLGAYLDSTLDRVGDAAISVAWCSGMPGTATGPSWPGCAGLPHPG